MKYRIDGKSQTRLLLLSMFVGLFGIEYFYVKKWQLGLAKLLITLLGASIMIWVPTVIATSNLDNIERSVSAQRLALTSIRELLNFGTPYAVDLANQIVVPEIYSIWNIPELAQAITVALIIGGVILGITLGWTTINAIMISLGKFKDENKKLISTWNNSEIDVIDHILSKGAK